MRDSSAVVFIPDVGTGAAALQQEGVAIVEEVHTLGSKFVDCCHMTAQRLLNLLLEEFRLFGHHHLGILEADAHGIVTACPGVVQRGLVGAQIHLDALFGAVLPQVNHIALVGETTGFLVGDGLVHLDKQLIEVGVDLINPTLFKTLLRSSRVDFSGDAHHTGDVASLGLSTAHATETGGDEQLACRAAAELTGSVQHGDSSAMHNALRADVHITAGGHLAVLCHTEGVVTLPVVGFAVVRYHHAIGNHHAGGILVRRIESHGVTAVHHQRLLVGHLREVFHHQTVLCPVLEHGAVAAVCNQLVGMLCHCRIQVVLNHQHDGGSLTALGGILVDGAGIHLVGRTQTVHIDAAVFLQLLGKLGSQHSMVLRVEIAEGVADSQLLFRGREDVLALGRMVHCRVIRLRFGQGIRNTLTQFILEFFECHITNLFIYYREQLFLISNLKCKDTKFKRHSKFLFSH